MCQQEAITETVQSLYPNLGTKGSICLRKELLPRDPRHEFSSRKVRKHRKGEHVQRDKQRRGVLVEPRETRHGGNR